MALVIKLHPNGHSLLAETEHGTRVPLPVALGDVGQVLFDLLLVQQAPKVVAPGVDGPVLSLVLAEWERAAPTARAVGQGFVRRSPATRAARLFTASGKELLPL